MLDAVGDLGLVGAELVGRFRAYCPGHKLNHTLLRRLFATPDAWRLTHAGEEITEAPAPRRRAAAG